MRPSRAEVSQRTLREIMIDNLARVPVTAVSSGHFLAINRPLSRTTRGFNNRLYPARGAREACCVSHNATEVARQGCLRTRYFQ